MTRRGTALLKVLLLACAGTLGGVVYAVIYYTLLPTTMPDHISLADQQLIQLFSMLGLTWYWIKLTKVGYGAALDILSTE